MNQLDLLRPKKNSKQSWKDIKKKKRKDEWAPFSGFLKINEFAPMIYTFYTIQLNKGLWGKNAKKNSCD